VDALRAISDAEPLEYLATQTIADFLATDASIPIDGIIFPSVQTARDALNVVLFHKAARVEAINVPDGTEIITSTGRWAEDGWREDYEVLEKAPPSRREVERKPGSPDAAAMAEATPLDAWDLDRRDTSLRVVSESVEVHRVNRVELATDQFRVERRRREKRGSSDS
jgi:hypothetical protein